MIGQEALPKGSTFLINMFLVSHSLDFDDAILAWKERDPICFFLFAMHFLCDNIIQVVDLCNEPNSTLSESFLSNLSRLQAL